MASRRGRILAVMVAVAALSAIPSRAQLRSFEVRVSGAGRPLIFIPGLASSGETWNTTVARYRDRFKRMRFVLSDTARHFIMFDDPEWFFGELDSFVADPMAATSVRGLQ